MKFLLESARTVETACEALAGRCMAGQSQTEAYKDMGPKSLEGRRVQPCERASMVWGAILNWRLLRSSHLVMTSLLIAD